MLTTVSVIVKNSLWNELLISDEENKGNLGMKYYSLSRQGELSTIHDYRDLLSNSAS